MSLTLNEILNKFPSWVCESESNKSLHVHSSSGFPLGWIHQDKTRCIYEYCVFEGSVHFLEDAEFLSNFKHKRLLTIKSILYTQYICVLKEIRNEAIQDTE